MDKEAIRQKIWDYMEKNNLVTFPRPCYGRIPNFVGAKAAGEKIQKLKEFQQAKAVFSAPDSSLIEVRHQTLLAGKSLLVALPHKVGYRELFGKELADKGITISGFSRYGKEPKTPVDLFVQGSVAVDLKGNRLGKGKGYGDKEYWELKNQGLLNFWCKVVTVVHDCQIVDDFSSIMEALDVKVDYILTPTQIIAISH
uniref:5-formyltetrahydrofolate cyclo-ligase n=1 Tax=candidate division WOR-3 bacterium TaxID=2052148 RepID=A0A7C6ECE0_UNCW3